MVNPIEKVIGSAEKNRVGLGTETIGFFWSHFNHEITF